MRAYLQQLRQELGRRLIGAVYGSSDDASKMSRLIVKNLPKNCTEERVRKHFKKFEPLTDVSLKYTPEGVFRKFAFVGFSAPGAADEAINFFNNTYFGTTRITCFLDFSAYKRLHGDETVLTEGVKRAKIEDATVDSKYANDPNFSDFLKIRGVKDDEQPKKQAKKGTSDRQLSLIFRGLPSTLKQTNLKEWLSPIRTNFMQLIHSETECFAFVTFNRPGDQRKALQRTDQFLGGFKKKKPKAEEAVEDFDVEAEKQKIETEIRDTGRLFLRNLPYICTESDLIDHFKRFGDINDCQCVVDRKSGNCKGFAMLTFMFPEKAVDAYRELDGTIFKGRMLHILPGKEKPEEAKEEVKKPTGLSEFQKKREAERKSKSQTATYSWNTLFMGANTVAETLADQMGVEKSDFLEGDRDLSAGVRMSLAETRLVRETREFLIRNGVVLDAFARPPTKRSDTVMIAKNLPTGIEESELREKFEKFGPIKRFLLPPQCKVTALIEMQNRVDAKKAFSSLAYSRLRTQPLYLEWAPADAFDPDAPVNEKPKEEVKEEEKDEVKEEEKADDESTKKKRKPLKTKMLVRNIPFQASVKEIRSLFVAFGELKTVRLPLKVGGQGAHRGFGFVDFMSAEAAKSAFDALVHSTHLYGRRMSTSKFTPKSSVSAADQQEINEFARVFKRLTEAKAEVRVLTNELQNYAEASDEVLLLDETDGAVPFQVGESFVYFTPEETAERLEYSKDKIQKAIDDIQLRIEDTQQKHGELKASLYAKFGDNIGLETED
ncbi:putative bacteriochlorophyll 4-vinyl reductase [Aphelenchoides besseyi]|nr:putative bacteriochlorophyll 4-vinyl reductase [Aphelenchoides besseyi]